MSFNQTRPMKILRNRSLNHSEQQEYFNYLVKKYNLTAQYSKKGLFFSEVQKNNSADKNYSGPYLLDMYNQSPLEFKSKCTIYEMIQLLQSTKSYRDYTQNASNNKIIILINQELTEKEDLEIKEIVRKLEGSTIKYSSGEISFCSLYEKYKLKITEKEFAFRLGITPYKISTMKKISDYSTKILDIDKISKAKKVMLEIKEARYYSYDELSKLCEDNDIDLKDFINYMDTLGYLSSGLLGALNRMGKLFILPINSDIPSKHFSIHKKHIPMTPNAFNTLYPILKYKLKKVAFKLIYTYHYRTDINDLIQIGLTAIFSSCGDLEHNFYENGKFETPEDEDSFFRISLGKAKRQIKFTILKEKYLANSFNKKNKHFVSYSTDDFTSDESLIYFEDDELINKDSDSLEIKADKLQSIIEKYLETDEYNGFEVIGLIQNRFGISDKEMTELLTILQKKMIDNHYLKKEQIISPVGVDSHDEK